MNFFGGDQKQQQQGPDPVMAATTEMQMYTGASIPILIPMHRFRFLWSIAH